MAVNAASYFETCAPMGRASRLGGRYAARDVLLGLASARFILSSTALSDLEATPSDDDASSRCAVSMEFSFLD